MVMAQQMMIKTLKFLSRREVELTKWESPTFQPLFFFETKEGKARWRKIKVPNIWVLYVGEILSLDILSRSDTLLESKW